MQIPLCAGRQDLDKILYDEMKKASQFLFTPVAWYFRFSLIFFFRLLIKEWLLTRARAVVFAIAFILYNSYPGIGGDIFIYKFRK